MLEDQPRDQVGCSRSLPDDQNARAGAPPHFGHCGGCASIQLLAESFDPQIDSKFEKKTQHQTLHCENLLISRLLAQPPWMT